jgi:hypothetical protein
MSTPKPRIRPKANPHRRRGDAPPDDPPALPEYDPRDRPGERDAGTEPKAPERVLFQEDDCLR